MEFIPNVHWLDAGGNLYLAIDPPNIILVDTGMPKKQKAIFSLLKKLGYQPSDLTHILVTHADIDHIGSLAVVQATSGAQVYAGDATAKLITQGKFPKHLPLFAQWILDTFMKYDPVSAEVITTFMDGETVPLLGGLQVMATPGHTIDHFSFFSPAWGILFAGDALDTRNGRINLTRPLITADKTAARQSAIRLLQLSPAVIACGHGKPSTNHTADQLMKIFNTLRQE